MARVTSILIYPDHDALGQTLQSTHVSADGLDGDRRKRSPVHLVAVENYIDLHPRANVVIDVAAGDLHGLVGRRLRLGTVELDVMALAGDCAGIYADIPVPGDLSVGDELLVGEPSA
jgi:hypothetical protein